MFFCIGSVSANSVAWTVPKISNLPSLEALAIGMKIWHNECGGRIDGLTSWNDGEDFASLGIGHFIWYSSGRGSDKDSFPRLIQYMRSNRVAVPKWLDYPVTPSCPWRTKEEFFSSAKTDPRFMELRTFLARTVAVQVQYLMYRLEIAIPQILMIVPAGERDFVYQKLAELLSTPAGVYVLVDYVNFKGDGVLAAEKGIDRQHPSWGLLQVLENMRYAPTKLTPLQAYAWSAKRVLLRRVLYAEPKRHEERWLLGWLNRVDGYLGKYEF